MAEKSRKEDRNNRRPSRGIRAQLVPKRTPGQRSPIRKEILHRVPTGNGVQKQVASRKLVFDEIESKSPQKNDEENDATWPRTAVEQFSNGAEKAALFETVHHMLNDRSASSKETLSNGAVRQDGILSQLDMLDAVLRQELPRRRARIESDDEESIRATRLEQQRQILKEIRQGVEHQFAHERRSNEQLRLNQSQMADELDATSKSLSEYVNENDDLRRQLEREGHVKMNLQKTIAEKSRQVEGLMAHLHDLRHELGQTSDQKERSSEMECLRLKESLAACETKIKSLEAKYAAMKEKAERKEEELVQVVMEHEKELESGELLEQRLDKSETRRAEEVEKLTQDLNKQTRRVEELVKERRLLQTDVDRLLNDNHRVSEALRYADVKNTELTLRNGSLEESAEQNAKRVREAIRAASHWENETKKSNQNVRSLTQERERLAAKFRDEETKHEEKAKMLLTEVSHLKSQLAQSGVEIAELKQQVEAVERLVTHRTQQQMQNLTGQLVKKSRAIEKLKQGNAFLKDRCQIAETDNEELKAALDGSSLNVTQLNSALDKTQLDLAQVREENSSLIEQVSRLNSTLSSLALEEGAKDQSEVRRSWSVASDLSTVSFKQLDVSVGSDVSQRFAEKLDDLQQRYEKQCDILKRRDDDLATLKKSYKLLSKAKDKASRALSDAESEAIALRNQLDESLATIREETGRRDDELAQMRRQLNEHVNAYETLKVAANATAEAKTRLERQNETIREELRKEVDELKSLLGTVNEEKNDLVARLSTKENDSKEIDELKLLLGTINDQKNDLLARLSAKENDLEKAMKNRAKYEEEQTRRHKAEIASLTELMLKQRRQVIAEVKSLQQVAQNEIQRIVRVLGKEKEKAVESTRAQVDRLVAERDELRSIASRVDATWLDYSETCLRRIGETGAEFVADEAARVDRIVDERRRVAATARDVVATNDATRAALEEKEARIRRLAADVDALKERKDALRDEREETLLGKLIRVEERCRELMSSERRSDESTTALGSLYDQLGSCTLQLRRLEGELARQEKEKRLELDALRTANARLVRENVALKNSQAKLTSENAALKASNDEMMKEHKEFVTKIKELTARCEQLVRVNKELKGTEVRRQRRRQQDAFDSSTQSLEAEKSLLEESVERLLKQNESLARRRESLEGDIERLVNEQKMPTSASTPKAVVKEEEEEEEEEGTVKLENERLKKEYAELLSRVERLRVEREKAKNKLKMKKRQANYLRLRLGGVLSEIRELKRMDVYR
ncbi:myosin-14-like isoform X2 [Oscarella lobularis]|uniref:myosin-14-like isoform X2 n=1 Tax=Oscarella lobularis TaxID=121494 RepID=UPI0033130A25